MRSIADSSLQRDERHDCEFCIEDLQTLLAAQRAIASSLEPGFVGQLTADEARRITSAEMSAVYLLKKDRLEIHAVSGNMRKSLLGHSVTVEGSLAGKAIQMGRSLLLEDARYAENLYSPISERFKANAILVVPLNGLNGVIGAILVANHNPDSITMDDQRLLEMMAACAANAFENARRFIFAQQAAARGERRRLANKLQGAVSQTLFSASLIADILPRLWDRDPQEGRIRMEELRKITRGVLVEVRSLLLDD